LKDDTYTFDQSDPKFEDRLISHGVHLQRIIQVVSDITNQPLDTLRVLDLGCLEGLYGIEFAQHGAEVIAIEGREANIEKARFAKDILGLYNITFVQDDVRNLSVEKRRKVRAFRCCSMLRSLLPFGHPRRVSVRGEPV
jgi:2-polyprenyl-3-methyl-5-hydroxy-6-metoxy-1,4-benzoquinol methylase